MAIANLNLPAAGGVDYNSGDVDYYKLTDPVYYVDDNRPLRNLAYRDTLIGTKVDEIINAMGGDEYVQQSEMDIYRPHEQDTPNTTVRIEPGQHIKSDGSGAVIKSTAFNSGAFAVVSSGKERYDVLVIDDSGNPQIVQGVEVASGTGAPLTDAPDFPVDQLVIAIVKVNETVTVVVNDADITDVREFLNKGGGGGGARMLSKREKQTASAGQTVFTLTTMSYNTGDDGLLVLRNGKMLNKDEYTKTSSTVVTLDDGATVGDILEFIYYYTETGLEAVAWELLDSHSIGDTVMNLSFSYSIGSHQLFVMRNGAMQVVGASYDYTETTTTSITLNTPIAKADEEILVFKFGAVQDSMNHVMTFHTDWEGYVPTFGTPGAEVGNAIEVDIQLKDLSGNNLTGEVALAVRVSDSDLGAASGSATIAAKGTPLGTILEGSGTAEVRVKTDSNGQVGVKVTEAAVASRYLSLAPTFGSPILKDSDTVTLVFT